MNTLKYKKGFTLVELLVVIAIIGILATLLLLQYNVAKAKGRDIARVTNVSQIRTALELYFEDTGYYPQKIDDSTAPPCCSKYMAAGAMPTDPSSQNPYAYGVDANPARRYQVWTQLEQVNANAFRGDSDVTDIPLPGTDGTKETGTTGKCTALGSDCVFDLGIK